MTHPPRRLKAALSFRGVKDRYAIVLLPRCSSLHFVRGVKERYAIVMLLRCLSLHSSHLCVESAVFVPPSQEAKGWRCRGEAAQLWLVSAFRLHHVAFGRGARPECGHFLR